MSNTLQMPDLLSACLNQCRDKQRMIKVMMDANHISERLVSMTQEISDPKVMNAQYWVKRAHTALEKSTHAFPPGNQARVVDYDETP